ncbi:MAG: hypothetical protein ACNA78_00650 [Balneolaceae bacterium]
MDKKRIDALLQYRAPNSVTITLPTHEKGEGVKQDPIRLKNLIKEAEDQLVSRGMKQKEAESLLEEVKELISKPIFWAYMDDGLVIMKSDEETEIVKTPYPVEERVYVRDHFLVTPLLPLISMDGTFSLLAVSRKNVRLLACTRNSVANITPESAETSIDEYLEEAPEKELQFHTGADGKDAMFFGHGSGKDEKKNVLEAFFRRLEDELTPVLNRRKDPLIIAGLEDNIAFYKKYNQYNRTMPQTVGMNPDELSDDELRDKGWEQIQSYFLKEMYASINMIQENQNKLVSNNLSDIIENTIMGKSKTVFIATNERVFGRYDDENHDVKIAPSPSEEDIDLLNFLALKARETGADVYALPKTEMPIQANTAAEFRF